MLNNFYLALTDVLTDFIEDMIFIGPNDLALSLFGYVPAKGNGSEFTEAIGKIVAAARRHSTLVARLSDNGALCKEHLKLFDTVALSYDVRAMQNWYAAELQHSRTSQEV